VLMNLVGNAMKFTEHGGVTLSVIAGSVTTRPEEKTGTTAMTFKITDTGVGIPQNQLGKIFESFTQVSGNKRTYGGTGLGLAISKNLVELMDGTLEVTSEEGKGSEFSFSLPFEVATEDQWQHYQKKELI